jgi:hypothetical protein
MTDPLSFAWLHDAVTWLLAPAFAGSRLGEDSAFILSAEPAALAPVVAGICDHFGGLDAGGLGHEFGLHYSPSLQRFPGPLWLTSY